MAVLRSGMAGALVLAGSILSGLQTQAVRAEDIAYTTACEACECCCDELLWTVRAGAVFLQRSNPDPQLIVQSLAGPTQISGGADFRFDTAVGPDISLKRRLNSGNSLEARYFGALNSTANAAFGAVGNFQLGSFSNFGSTNLVADYRSRLNSAEVNWLHPVTDRVTMLAGFRWLELKDDLTYGVTFPAFSANYNWHEINQLYGGQLGGNFSLWNLDGPFTINAGMKAGIYSNSATNDFSLRPSTGGLFAGGAAQGQIAFIGDINVTARYQIADHIALVGGYQFLWVDGVALSSNQAAAATAAASQNAIDTHNSVFYHGALASVEITW